MDDLIQSESLVRPGICRRTRTREHIVGHTDVGNQILENIPSVKSEDLMMGAPARVPPERLKELHIKLDLPPVKGSKPG